MPAYRSRTTTHGRNMAGARGLWRATGMKDSDFGKPIIAVVNSFTQFVPGHVHLKDLGQLVAREIEQAGGVALGEIFPLQHHVRPALRQRRLDGGGQALVDVDGRLLGRLGRQGACRVRIVPVRCAQPDPF